MSADVGTSQIVEVSDHGHAVCTAQVNVPDGRPGTVQAFLRAESGHIAPGRRASLVDAVLDLPDVRSSTRLQATVPRGDGESLQRLRERCTSVTTHVAGCTVLVDAELALPLAVEPTLPRVPEARARAAR